VAFIQKSKRTIRVLDLGGTQYFWYQLGLTNNSNLKITILNIKREKIVFNNITHRLGSALNLGKFNDKEFDLVFSNSLLEHIANYEDQIKVAREIKRIGKTYIVQTPNKYFPIEPHYFLPFFYLVPRALRPYYVTFFSLKWRASKRDFKELGSHIGSIRLLKAKELENMFMGDEIVKEKFLFLTKSFVVYSKNLNFRKL